MSTKNAPRPSSKRPIMPVSHHGGNQSKQLLIYIYLRKEDREARIFFEKETVPRYLYGQMRTVRLYPFKSPQVAEHKDKAQAPPDITEPPIIYVFRPWPGLEVLINPVDKSFFVKTETQEYGTVRDKQMKLVLK